MTEDAASIALDPSTRDPLEDAVLGAGETEEPAAPLAAVPVPVDPAAPTPFELAARRLSQRLLWLVGLVVLLSVGASYLRGWGNPPHKPTAEELRHVAEVNRAFCEKVGPQKIAEVYGTVDEFFQANASWARETVRTACTEGFRDRQRASSAEEDQVPLPDPAGV